MSVAATAATLEAAITSAGSAYRALSAEVERRAAVYSDHPDYDPDLDAQDLLGILGAED